MINNNFSDINKKYIAVVSVLTFIFPILCAVGEILVNKDYHFHLT